MVMTKSAKRKLYITYVLERDYTIIIESGNRSQSSQKENQIKRMN